ncbi:MAG: hypothetical protein FJX31_09850, partial [Alphaproteobacteria bacterium]|nr:hypothetical protein [Alphaproteobacteria bacterium]
MLLDRVYFLVGELRVMGMGARKGAKGAVALVPPGAPGDLRHLGSGEAALAHAVELGQASKGDVIDV